MHDYLAFLAEGKLPLDLAITTIKLEYITSGKGKYLSITPRKTCLYHDISIRCFCERLRDGTINEGGLVRLLWNNQ